MNPELRDLTAKWISYPPRPYTNDPDNLFEIEVVSGNGSVSRVTLTRLQAAEVARQIGESRITALDEARLELEVLGDVWHALGMDDYEGEDTAADYVRTLKAQSDKRAADAAQEGEAKNA